MESSEINITLSYSLTGRIVTRIVQMVNQLGSRVYLEKGTRTVNMKSILGILSAGCMAGDNVKIICLNKSYDKAQRDLNTIKAIIETGDF